MINTRAFGLAGILVAFAFLSGADDIVTTNGKTYFNCTIKLRYSSGVKILHKAGVAYIPYAEMTDEDKVKYGFDSKENDALFAEKKRQKEEADRTVKDTIIRKTAKKADEDRVKQERKKAQEKVEAAKKSAEDKNSESSQIALEEAEEDTVEFALRTAMGFVKEWIDNGKLIDAKCLGARPSLFPFGGEPNENFFSKRFLVDFEFKYQTIGGFERINNGTVQMGYLKQDKKWHSVHFNESTVTGVPYLKTGEGRAMIERAAVMGFAQLNQTTATQKVTRAGVTRGTGTRGEVTGKGRLTEGGFSSTDKRWQNAKRIGR